MEGVRCISSTLVQASSTHRVENQRVELTHWDLRLLLFGPIQKGLLFRDGEISDGNTIVDTLKASLSRTLCHFTPLKGRLATAELDDETVSFVIDCNDAGALFVHAEADGVTISDIIEPVYVPSIVHSFFPLNGITNYDGISQPLLGVQVTKLANGRLRRLLHQSLRGRRVIFLALHQFMVRNIEGFDSLIETPGIPTHVFRQYD